MLSQFFADYNGLEFFFVLCAIIGGVLVLVRLIGQFSGAAGEADAGADFGPDPHHADSDTGFQYLSLHGLSSFLMMFGLFGLALYRQSQLGLPISVVGAVIGGLGSVWIIGKLFQSAGKLQATGTLQTQDAVGSIGTVYMNIPANGTGRVNIDFQNHLREFDAREKSGAALLTGTQIRVVEVSGNVLVVEKLA